MNLEFARSLYRTMRMDLQLSPIAPKSTMRTPRGLKSIPAWIKYSAQLWGWTPYDALYYDPPEKEKYVFEYPRPKKPKSLRIYECHVGMSSKDPVINSQYICQLQR